MQHATYQAKGLRPTMEDTHFVTNISGIHFFGLFDGHGGSETAYLAQLNIPNLLAWKLKTNRDLDKILQKVGVDFDRKLMNYREYIGSSGTTSLIVAITEKEIYLANCGDSRAILIDSKGKILGKTLDHKPDRVPETQRILKSGGLILQPDNRVAGVLSVSRGFGDFEEGLKLRDNRYLGTEAPVSPLADVYKFAKLADSYLVLACDGLWDVYTSEEVAKWISSRKDTDLKVMAKELVNSAIHERESTDNVTVTIIKI